MSASQENPLPNFIKALQSGQTKETLTTGKQVLTNLNQHQFDSFQSGTPVAQLLHERSLFIDQLLKQIWKHFLGEQHQEAALIAVGGYGREEMQPYSDVDLLIVCNECESFSEPLSAFFTLLWDLGFNVGHAVRTVEQCKKAGLEDIVTATNLLEARWITGDYTLFEQVQALWKLPDFWPSKDFFTAKLKEQQQRHARFHDTLYQLEPNLKESPGGLRDIQTIFWVAKRHFNARSINDLVRHQFITPAEYQELEAAYLYLNRIRFALHMLKKRHEDRLLFENQQKVAELFGFKDEPHKLAVEQFMSRYYRNVQISSNLNESLLQHFREELFTAATPQIMPVNPRFQIVDRYLDLHNPDILEQTPSAILETFIILEHFKDEIDGIRARTIRQIRNHLNKIDDAFRKDPLNKALFIEILRQPQGVYASLKRMHTYGILSAYLPAFQKISGLMQFNIFHAYTVDEHTILVIRNLRRFFIDEFAYEFPTAHKVAQQICKPELLFLAGLFHDIAKGRGGKHEVLGAEEALKFGHCHNLPEKDTQLISWLVRHHLDFSDFAQRRDLSDPSEIAKFAQIVKDQAHLDYLYLLTLADVISTSDGVWNDWKNALFLQLYNQTTQVLDKTAHFPKDKENKALQNKEKARELLSKREIRSQDYSHLWQCFEHSDFFSRQTADEIARLTKKLYQADFNGLMINFEPSTQRGASELMLFLPDRDYLFADITYLIEKRNLNIVEAKIYTSKKGMTLVLIYLLDAEQNPITDETAIQRLLSDFSQLMAHPVAPEQPPEKPLPRRMRCFETPTQIEFHKKSDRYTELEITTKDIPGLLSRIALAFKFNQIRMHDAKINTIGEKVEDIFLISTLENQALSTQQQEQLTATLLELIEDSLRNHR